MPHLKPAGRELLSAAQHKYNFDIYIDCKIPKVFATLVDGDTWPQWLHGLSIPATLKPESGGLGATRFVEGRFIKTYEEITVWEENAAIGFSAVQCNLAIGRQQLHLFELTAKDEGTLLRHSYALSAPLTYIPITIPLMSAINIYWADAMRAFKRYCE